MRSILAATFALLSAGCASRPATVRVAFDAHGVTAAEAHGFADRATRRRVTADDPVRVASISKLVVALGVMRLVEAGTLDLDRDVSSWLGWQVRNPNFPGAPITLRLLLSHRSSLTDGADYAVPLGETVRNRLADPRAWDAEHPPGTYFRYANIGFPVIAGVIERATGERFDHAMARLVLTPLHLDACFNWSAGCSDQAVGDAVVLYRHNGEVALDDLHGRRPSCPVLSNAGCDLTGYRLGDNGALFSPQGGLRISMHDLAAIGVMLLRHGDGFLSPQSVALLEKEQWQFDGANGDTEGGFYCRYGFAAQSLPTAFPGCRDDLFADGRPRVGHAGDAYGLKSGLWLDRAAGAGVAFFATSVPDGSQGRSAFSREEERLARRRR